MKTNSLIAVFALMLCLSCATEFEIASTDLPEAVLKTFNDKYPSATDVEWEAEKKNGKLYFEAEFKVDGKTKEAYFRPDGTFSFEEVDE